MEIRIKGDWLARTGLPLSDRQMLPEIAALFFAGIDTTGVRCSCTAALQISCGMHRQLQACVIHMCCTRAGHTGTWALYLISQHPEVEARVAAELDAAELLVTSARPEPRRCCYDDLARLPYLKCVIKVSVASAVHAACPLAELKLSWHARPGQSV